MKTSIVVSTTGFALFTMLCAISWINHNNVNPLIELFKMPLAIVFFGSSIVFILMRYDRKPVPLWFVKAFGMVGAILMATAVVNTPNVKFGGYWPLGIACVCAAIFVLLNLYALPPVNWEKKAQKT